MPDIPLERDEQIELVQWCEDRGLKITAVPNSTFTKSWKQKNTNRLTGVRAGFPDLVVLISPEQSKDGEGYFLCIELKRQKGGALSDVQKSWQSAINGLGCPNVQAYVCKGATAAQTVIEHYLASSVLFETF